MPSRIPKKRLEFPSLARYGEGADELKLKIFKVKTGILSDG
jgi:hypothetical protein